MTIKEISTELGTSVKIIYSLLNFLSVRFEKEEDFILSFELCDEVRTEFFFRKKDGELIQEILKYNNLTGILLLDGTFSSVKGKNFAFFKGVNCENMQIYYPVTDGLVDNIYILPTKLELKEGERYTFEVKLASEAERRKKGNPCLLQAETNNLRESIKLAGIFAKIKQTNEELDLIESQKKQKLEEANAIIEEFNVAFKIKEEELLEKEKEIEEKLEIINNLELDFDKRNLTLENLISEKHVELQNIADQTQLEFQNFIKEKNKMESTLNFLRKKLDLCKNLEFLSDNDASSYLNIFAIEDSWEYMPPDFEKTFETDLNGSFSDLCSYIQSYLFFSKNLVYTRFQIVNFLTLLRTHDIIVLSGLSGSGKTQIVKAFAEAIGGVAKIIPVKPNWTSSDDLLGYYNPIQSSFLPTPFTEAIIEAIQNPNQLYLICLDEMNLARVEYYFADFLSKLEERGQEPQIELYAHHEEDLFLSEFKTLLNIVESSIKDYEITSWRDFLDNDQARNRFFAMLGNSDNNNTLSIHAKMKRRLLDILKFPSTIKIPNNIRFIGAINVDETTNYFSPKILDRIHLVRFENPLKWDIDTITKQVTEEHNFKVYVNPSYLGQRSELPKIDSGFISNTLKEINNEFLDKLNIDFGIRSIRQSILYAELYSNQRFEHEEIRGDYEYMEYMILSEALNILLMQKVLPRFSFDSQEMTKDGKKKLDIVKSLQEYIRDKKQNHNEYYEGTNASDFLVFLIKRAEESNGLVNFWA